VALSGAERDRTVGLLNAIQALSQLSYSPVRTRPVTGQRKVTSSTGGGGQLVVRVQ
jgi:hypothetical protein